MNRREVIVRLVEAVRRIRGVVVGLVEAVSRIEAVARRGRLDVGS